MKPEFDRKREAERLIERFDKPLLMLAVFTLVAYLIDLLDGLGRWKETWLVLSLIIDVIFVFDLLLKLWTYSGAYTRTPWFLIDFISCLPLFDALATGITPIRAVRFVRGFRMLRILRGLRLLRALKTLPAFEQFINESPPRQKNRSSHQSMSLGLIGMTVMVLIFIVASRKQMEREFIERIDHELVGNLSVDTVKILGGSFQKPRTDAPIFERQALVDGRQRTIYFDLEPVERRSDSVEFFVIVGMMMSMLFLMYIFAFNQIEATQSQLRALLHMALPKQVSDRFLADPSSYSQKSRMPATILFMDLAGFTKTCESLSKMPDELSDHLEQAMDRLVSVLRHYDMIIDKFIGDAVMSFRGGPLVSGDPREHAYRTVRAALASTKALRDLDDPYFHQVKIGGASSDSCLIGAFGGSGRLSYTILGDGVNLAARLEPASSQCGTENLFCHRTKALCDDQVDLGWRRWGLVRVAGKSEPVEVFEAFDLHTSPLPAFITTYEAGMASYERRDFETAHELFVRADQERGQGDPPSRLNAKRCKELLQSPPNENWESALVIHK